MVVVVVVVVVKPVSSTTDTTTPLPPLSDLSLASGWRLSPSAEAYEVIAFTAALQYFYNTRGDPVPVGPTTSPRSSSGTPSSTTSATEIDNTPALGPTIMSVIEMLLKGRVDNSRSGGGGGGGGGGMASSTTTTRRRKRAAVSPSPSTKKAQHCQAAKDGLLAGYQLLHYLVLQLLQLGTTYSFECCVVYVVIAAVMHSDLVGLLYLTLFVILSTNPRPRLQQRWSYTVYAAAVLVMTEYWVVLRLPPAARTEVNSGVNKVLGARQCSVFHAYTPSEVKAYPYEYGQWLGLCITDDSLLVVDFVFFLMTVLQSKRFRAGE